MSLAPDSQRKTIWTAKLLVFCLLFAVAVALQWFGGAYQAEFGSEPDEAGHYVTGLFVHDFVKAGFPRQMRQFGENYYDHYPKVALGHWGPTFYLIQTAWALIFSPQRESIMILMAVLAALGALVLYCLLAKEFGRVASLIGALVFIAIPLVQQYTAAVMTEIPITLLVLLAVVFFARYLETERKRDSVGFAVCAALVILIKFSGFLLVFVPPITILLTRKFHLLKKFSLWLAAIVVAILAGPWSIKTVKLATNGISDDPFGWAFTHKAVPYYFTKLTLTVGLAITVLAVFGLIVKWPRKGTSEKGAIVWASVIALLFSVLFAAMVIPAGYEVRHLIPALPAVIALAIAGAEWISKELRRRNVPGKVACGLACGVPLVLFFVLNFRIPHKGWAGFQEVARWLNVAAGEKEKFLVSSDARGEGMFICEVAMHDGKRPKHYAERTSKKFADTDWSGSSSSYKLLYAPTMSAKKEQKREYTNADEAFALLQQDTVGYVVIDRALERPPKHEELLREIIEKHPDNFVLEKKFPIERSTKELPNGKIYPDGILVYRFKR